MDQGIQILNLGQNAHHLFARQPAKEKRSLLNFLLSNSTWAQASSPSSSRNLLIYR
jgi:site-specific DNA recombinase